MQSRTIRSLSYVLILVMTLSAPAIAADSDGDGITDDIDVCNNTPFGTAVDPQGRPLADLDLDCDTDLSDFETWQPCLAGTNIPIDPSCQQADLDSDGDVDLADYSLFQQGFTGEIGDVPQGMVLIPAGEFMMGDSLAEGFSDEFPAHTVYIDAFYMQTTEVTNQKYAEALNWAYQQGLIRITSGLVFPANQHGVAFWCDTTESSDHSQITFDGSTFGSVPGKEQYPVTRVNFYGAASYCNWRSLMEGKTQCYTDHFWNCDFSANGYRLPTEAEWEKAARGGTPSHRFPWTDAETIQHTRANYTSSESYDYDTSLTRGTHPTFFAESMPYSNPVGYFPPNGYGLYDMAGSLLEWCNDIYDASYYSNSPYENPQGPTSGFYRVLRGGSWGSGAIDCRCSSRIRFNSAGSNARYGFRVVLPVPQD